MKVIHTRSLLLCALFSALIAIGAFIKIPIPIVPFTLQFLFTTLAGLLLGSKLGFVSVSVYIVLGLIGLPVFTQGGGIGYLLQPTFGYIIGFAVGAFVTGFIMEQAKKRGFITYLSACFMGLLVVYALGMVYYYVVANYFISSPIGIWSLFLYCFVLAVPGDILICFLCALLSKRLIPLLRKKAI